MMKIGELKKVFSAVRLENLRALLRYSARPLGRRTRSSLRKKPERMSATSMFPSRIFMKESVRSAQA